MTPMVAQQAHGSAGLISQIEALNFRSLKYVRQPLKRFHVLVGPNATGKTTFLDILPFLSELVSEGPQAAVKSRSDNHVDLICERHGDGFELAIEALLPDEIRRRLAEPDHSTIRYEVKIGLVKETQQVGILGEKAVLKRSGDNVDAREAEFGDLFPREISAPSHIYSAKRQKNSKLVLHKNPEGNDNFYSETLPNRGGGWLPSFRFGPNKSALGNLPDDGSRFPASTWLRDFLSHDIQRLVLNSLAIRRASPPGDSQGFKLDGSNLPWVISGFRKQDPELFKKWIAHIQTALPDIEDIDSVEREDDRHLYIVVRYRGGLEIPSWMTSDGTLRTLPAYLPNLRGVFLIEEPENGIHPRAIEAVVQSLSSVYHAQVLLATHSSVIVNAVELDDILCFSKDAHGATDIVSGPEHPALREWKKESNLGLLFAAGVLG